MKLNKNIIIKKRVKNINLIYRNKININKKKGFLGFLKLGKN